MTFIRFITCAAAAVSLSLAAAARAEDKVLTIYTYDSFISEWGPGPQVKEEFEKTCACKVNFVGIEDGVALLNRLKLEGPSAKADLVLGLDTSLTEEASKTGLFAPHDIDASAASVPGGYKDSVFVPYDYGHFAVVYDSQTLKNPPKSMKELIEGDPAQKIVIQDPRTSTPGLGLLLWIKAIYGDKAPEAWARLKDRVLTVTPGWSEAYGLFTKGEAPMVLSYSTSPAYHIVEEKTDRYKATEFSEGHYIQIEVAGLLKASRQPALARDFLRFMLSPAFQDQIPTKNWMMPVAKTSAPLPEAFATLIKPQKTFDMPSETVAENRKAWIAEWQAAMAAK
ncbi:thiamine ABC transporter substrate binding subunit [Allorhizobium undicola]|uniref:thiamine ABC transporter substrate binding subunit n=1 Tax=Allorhizobium undicola TaxID=78527 RepID=UPI0004843D38|nr:thiamine ABC transporter substrate binding subunit [Allorhizobium undicola]